MDVLSDEILHFDFIAGPHYYHTPFRLIGIRDDKLLNNGINLLIPPQNNGVPTFDHPGPAALKVIKALLNTTGDQADKSTD